MKKLFYCLLMILVLSGCSKKKDDIGIDDSYLNLIILQVSDSEGNDLLDPNSEKCILNPEYLNSGNCYEYVCTRYYKTPTNKIETEVGSSRATLSQFNGKYVLELVFPPIPETSVLSIDWKDEIDGDELKYELLDCGTETECVAINGVRLELAIPNEPHCYRYELIK